jgi:hypothetical protein
MAESRDVYSIVLPGWFPRIQEEVDQYLSNKSDDFQQTDVRPRVLLVSEQARNLESMQGSLGPFCELLVAGPKRPCKSALEKWQPDYGLLLALVDLKIPDQPDSPSLKTRLRLIHRLRKRPGAVIMIRGGLGDLVKARIKLSESEQLFYQQELGPNELRTLLQLITCIQGEEPELTYNWALTNWELREKYTSQGETDVLCSTWRTVARSRLFSRLSRLDTRSSCLSTGNNRILHRMPPIPCCSTAATIYWTNVIKTGRPGSSRWRSDLPPCFGRLFVPLAIPGREVLDKIGQSSGLVFGMGG